jgi:hypothetical protein
VQLDREGIETIKWPYTADVNDLTTVKVYLAGSWHVASLVSGNVELLVAGPDAASPGSAVVLPLGRNDARVEFPDFPEVVVRGGGTIWVR